MATPGKGSSTLSDEITKEKVALMYVDEVKGIEFYVSNKKAKEGVLIKNLSPVEPLVILKHFGPDVGIPAKPVK